MLQDFEDACGQFKRIMEDSGFIKLERLKNESLRSGSRRIGLVEKYCFLSEREESFIYKDLQFDGDWQ